MPHTSFTPAQELKDHVIIMGYGRSGQLIAQLLSENLIPFVAIDAATDQVAKGKVRAAEGGGSGPAAWKGLENLILLAGKGVCQGEGSFPCPCQPAC